MARIAMENENGIGKTITTVLTPGYVINEATSVASETYRNKQQSRLIAKLIAITRFPNTYTLDSERQGTINKLESYDEDIKGPIKEFIAQLDRNPLADQRPFVRSLLNNQTRGGVK